MRILHFLIKQYYIYIAVFQKSQGKTQEETLGSGDYCSNEQVTRMKVWTLRVGVAFSGMRPAVGNSRLRGGISLKADRWGKCQRMCVSV